MKSSFNVCFDAVLPANGQIVGNIAQASSQIKALIQKDGHSLLARTIQAVHICGASRIVVVGNDDVCSEAIQNGATRCLAPGKDGAANILIGLDWLTDSPHEKHEWVMICPTDMPYLCAEKLNDFISQIPEETDLLMPLIAKQDFESRFPHTNSTYLNLKEGVFASGGVFMVRTAAINVIKHNLSRAFSARKSQFKLALLVGLPVIFKLVMGRLSITDIEKRIHQMTGLRGKAILNVPPELAFDVDTSDDLAWLDAHEHMQAEFESQC